LRSDTALFPNYFGQTSLTELLRNKNAYF